VEDFAGRWLNFTVNVMDTNEATKAIGNFNSITVTGPK
jgi:hypothetical protein